MSQDEYFSVHAHLKINVEELGDGEHVPSDVEFGREIPIAFRIASDCGVLDSSVEKEIHTLHNDQGHALSKFLTAQNEKINLLLGFMLSQQDDPNLRFQTETFGASSLTFIAKKAFQKGQHLRLKLFLENPPSAIYCYGTVYGCKEKNGKFAVGIKYTRLQEEDRDVLIRAALHQQQKLLRQRALERDN
ncbi:PilZ domain-containing protein [Enterovibrio makurazakiensis]|uniref:PilZ domain-containing protein n=1 Tax=Enterovibrio gelatinilyticus TaxID=2899819 RepID=A0ABT5R4K9_9GAMM|nr:PilZ domain-containing protein [Enterovibrio sp. ZSDZ42]MDD1794770.1 PilZ domain-containing protein [Enterovibrio sp. ZSDZ42]